MKKPFDVSVEQLAHDLALISVSNLSSAEKKYLPQDYYAEYISEYRMIKDIIENDTKSYESTDKESEHEK
ncbi:hypothetical protein LJB89_02315 [Tyzzerella sp. OttesenSCG-928-J15]|nr:hypothetical protein [Tyzzerella sp. OttesenSCG-928-J15]